MFLKRLIYQEWIVELGFDPYQIANIFNLIDKPPYNQKIIGAVRKAMTKLTPLESEFIERFYFCGETVPQIAVKLNTEKKRIKCLHRLSARKLRKYLAAFVKEEFDITVVIGTECILCKSPHRAAIDKMIKSKKKEETWKKINRILKEKYQIKITTPQILIGHQKYHMTKGEIR